MKNGLHSILPRIPRLYGAVLTFVALYGMIMVVMARPRNVMAADDHEQAVQARHAYNEKIEKTYRDPFLAKSHFLPSNMTTDTGEFIDPKSFLTAQYCGRCHKESHQEWRESAHSNSNRAPWYLRNVNLLKAEKGMEFTRHCEGCHDPVAVAAGTVTSGPGEDKRRPFDADGVTCTVCHSIQKVDTRGTGSFVLGVPAVLVDEQGQPILRAVSDAEILAHLDRHSAAVMKPFYKTSEFCASCHKAALPHDLNDYKWQRAISLYDEWQNSSFAKQSPLPFYQKADVSTCQTCHMQTEGLKLPDPGAKHGQLASHRWLGANTVVPEYYGYDEQLRRTKEFLQKNVFNVDIFALEHGTPANLGLSAGPAKAVTAPLGRVAYAVAAGEVLTADVVIQNKGIAHSHVPEQRDMYESWVDFTVTDDTGKVLKESGFMNAKTGALDERAHSFTNRLINVNGDLNAEHQVWDNRVVAYNNTIQSGRSQVVRYSFRMPAREAGKITLTATVQYRRFNQHFIDFGMDVKDGKHYPQTTVSMASGSVTLGVGENAATLPATGENPEWMRWNNYGIALLDAQQFDAAMAAFAQVSRLRPDYADGFTNQAIAAIAWQKYSDARGYLEKALTLAPDNMRATYYRALLERSEGKLDDAIVDFRRVTVAFPRSRDAHRELGFSLYQQHQYAEARAEYELVQGIDPDDLSAHYNLAILYRRLGMKEQAQQQAAIFADQKDDPTASTYALAFLRRHAEIANESVVWHTHDLDSDIDHPEGALPSSFSATQQ